MDDMMERSIISGGNIARFQTAFKKAQAKVPMTIGFIGGSITQGSLASTSKNCYAYHVFEWWKNKFPDTEFSYINAGIGATTSQFGVARVDSDLLSYEPDVVFLEFSVNDGSELKYFETFEGLVRKILLHKKQIALFMFNNVCYDTGFNAQLIHNRIGLYYDLPIVSMKQSIYQEIINGRMNAPDITPDNLHPNDKGHRLVADIIDHLLEVLYERSSRLEDSFQPFLPAALSPNRYIQSKRYNKINCSPAMSGFITDTSEQTEVSDVFKNGWIASCVGDSITFTVKGAMVSIQYRRSIHKPAPIADVFIDGDRVGVLDANFEETWGDCLALQDVMVAGEDTLHTVTIRIVKADNLQSDFYLASVITA